MRKAQPIPVIGQDGLKGVLLDPLPEHVGANDRVRIQFTDGRLLELPTSSIVMSSDGICLIPIGPADLQPQAGSTFEQVGSIPVLAEELVVEKKPVQTGGVRVKRHVLDHEETVEVSLLREHVDIRHVILDREVNGPLPVRQEGDTTIIPIVEEVLVVEKRFRLKEEIHVRRTVHEQLHRERVTVGRQEAEVEEFDAEGRTRPVRSAPGEPERQSQVPKRKSILSDQ
jgi:uncharacterized protein (TIGR02271 family)